MTKHSLRDDIGYWLNRLRMVVHSAFELKLKEYGITVPQWCILVSIYNKDGENVSALASYIDIDKGFVSRLVEQLVQMKLVQRKEGKDRRTQNVKLTPQAINLTQQLIDCAKQNEADFFNVLSASEKSALQSILIKLLNNAEIDQLGGFLKEEKNG